MSERIKCKKCENMILAITAKHNNGLCGPCLQKAKNKVDIPIQHKFTGKYDDASWHYGGDFPSDLPPKAGATHIGMFLAWAILNNLAGEFMLEEFAQDISRLKHREITGTQFLIENCDEKLTVDELNEKGNAFAKYYFDGHYLTDYENTIGKDLPSLYHVEDTWENFDKLKERIDKRFAYWSQLNVEEPELQNESPWWKFWK